VVSFSSGQFTPWKSPRHPLAVRLSGTHGWYQRDSEEKNFCPCWESNPGRPACSLMINIFQFQNTQAGRRKLHLMKEGVRFFHKHVGLTRWERQWGQGPDFHMETDPPKHTHHLEYKLQITASFADGQF